MHDMDAAELLLRDRVHHAYDALAPAGPAPARVIGAARGRIAERAERRRHRAVMLAVGAGVAVFSVASVQIVPRTVMLRPQPETATGGGLEEAQSEAGAAGPVSTPAPARTAVPPLCTTTQLAVNVSTNLPSYGTGDVVNVSTTLRNQGRGACIPPPPYASVWITNSAGQQWQLCPEPPTTTPTPRPTPAGQAPPMALMAPSVPALVSGPIHPGQSLSTACTWHTSYTAVPPGTYTVHATWSSSTATATVSVAPTPRRRSPTINRE